MTELIDSFSRIVSIIVAFVGVAGTLFFVYGAFQYMSAGGNTSKAESGKSAMVQAGVGVVLAIVAFAVINTITSQIGESGGAVQVQQVVGTDAQRLEAPRVTTVGQSATNSFVVTFTEAVDVINPDGLKMGTAASGALDLTKPFTDGSLEITFCQPNGATALAAGVIITGFIFSEGAAIKDSDGNNALYAFQPHTSTGVMEVASAGGDCA